ncbi:MAG: fibronectin type III domain-containing protein, partial [Thermoplasmatota archaeon]
MFREFFLVAALVLMSLSMNGSQADLADTEVIDPVLSSQPVNSYFTENLGQWDDELCMVAGVPFGHIGLGSTGFIYDIAGQAEGKGCILRYELEGADTVRPQGIEELSHMSNYFYGNDPSDWISGAKSYRSAYYLDVWNGIDIQFELGTDGAKYEFLIEPNADPGKINIGLSGHRSVEVGGDDLLICLDDGRYFIETGLKAFYGDDPNQEIEVAFLVDGNDGFRFDLGGYDRSRPVVIDPLLMQSTFLGGSGGEGGGISIEGGDGCIYVVGDCGSTGFPTTPGAYDDTWNYYYDLVISKMDHNLTTLLYATYVGGKDLDYPTDICYADNGEVVITGLTNSDNFPVTNGSFQTERIEKGYYNTDLFLLRLNSTGGSLVYSTFIGWPGRQAVPHLMLDSRERPIIITGASDQSVMLNERLLNGTFNGGEIDILIFGMDRNASSIDHARFIGGSQDENVLDAHLVGDDVLNFGGTTNSTDYPVVRGSYQENYNGTWGYASILCRYNISSGDMERSTFINHLNFRDFDLDTDSSVVVVGTVNSSDFSTPPDAFQKRYQGGRDDAFVLRMSADFKSITNATYLGSKWNDSVSYVALNETGHVFVTGLGPEGFPVTPGSLSTIPILGGDLYVDVLNPDLTELVYGTFIGGSRWEVPGSIYTGPKGTVVLSGETCSGGFPVVNGCYDTSLGGSTDIFISRLKCIKVYLPPLCPMNLTGRVVGDQIEIEWDEPKWDGDAPVIGYNISRVDRYGRAEEIATTRELNYTDTNVDIAYTYTYLVTAYNRIGDSPESDPAEIWEVETPLIEEDLTRKDVRPGEDITFSARITDNSRIDEVWVVYWMRPDEPYVQSMTLERNNTNEYRISMEDREIDIHYRFVVFDEHGNKASSNNSLIQIRGPYLPYFKDDTTPEEVQAFESMTFSIKAFDNWGEPEVWLEYWTGDGPRRNTTLSSNDDGTYFYTVGVTGRPGERIYYRFRAEDDHGNWNSTEVRTVRIVDGMMPIMEVDLSDGIASTGDLFSFRTMVKDDLGIGSVKVIYSIGTGPEGSMELEMGDDAVWSGNILVPHTLGEFSYRFSMEDSFENTNETEVRTLHIVDNDRPSILNHSRYAETFSGQNVQMSCEGSDNIEVERSILWYRIGTGGSRSLELSGSGVMTGSLEIPLDAEGSLEYYFEVIDTSGNDVRSGTESILIHD